MQLAAAIGVTVNDVVEWELGRTEPTTSRLRALTEHFGVRDDQIDLKPGHAPSITERLTDALEGDR
jgi:transcriptional regulator with XRE-family HTH domain